MFFYVFLLLLFFYVKNVLFCYIILLYFDKLHLKCMIILCTVQRGSAYKLLTSTSTFFRSICFYWFYMLIALLDEHDFLVHELL